jgi:hypothetical protein
VPEYASDDPKIVAFAVYARWSSRVKLLNRKIAGGFPPLGDNGLVTVRVQEQSELVLCRYDSRGFATHISPDPDRSDVVLLLPQGYGTRPVWECTEKR